MIVGKVNEEEKAEIQRLFERRNGLQELAKIVTGDNTQLYEQLIKDLGETSTAFQKWWDDMEQKYHWKGSKNGTWEINFETNEITLND